MTKPTTLEEAAIAHRREVAELEIIRHGILASRATGEVAAFHRRNAEIQRAKLASLGGAA